MRLSPRDKHLRNPIPGARAHVLKTTTSVGALCGKRVVTVFERCVGLQCRGELVSVEQYQVARGQRP